MVRPAKDKKEPKAENEAKQKDPKKAPEKVEKVELFVTKLSADTTEQTLEELFSQHGEVVAVKLVAGRADKQSFAFVGFKERAHAQAALDALNGKHTVEGADAALRVNFAKTPSDAKRQRTQDNTSTGGRGGSGPGGRGGSGRGGFGGRGGRGMGGMGGMGVMGMMPQQMNPATMMMAMQVYNATRTPLPPVLSC